MHLLLLFHPSSYSASKAATRAMADCLRLELKTTNNDHIRVSTICPQFVSTGMFKGCCSNEYYFVIFFTKTTKGTGQIMDKNSLIVLGDISVGSREG